MFAYIKGKLVDANPLSVIVDVGGIGYKIFISARAFGQLPKHGETVFLHTAFIVREASQTLYGFLASGERELFEALLNVSGVGPKLALALIGHLTLEDLQRAINAADTYSLSKVPGVGKRTAERLIVELKDKLPALFPRDIATSPEVTGNLGPVLIKDAVSALVNLGYTQAIAKKAIQDSLKELPEDVKLPVLITTALKNV